MLSRQRQTQLAHRALGLCEGCSAAVWEARRCFRCAVNYRANKMGLSAQRRRAPRAWATFVAGLEARYTKILYEEGFAVDAFKAPQALVAVLPWAKYRLKKRVLEIVSLFDDRAIRKRFQGEES